MASELELAKQEIWGKILQLVFQNARQEVGVLANGNISAHHDINVNISNLNGAPQPAQPAQESVLEIYFKLRDPTDYFTGRQSDLETLDQKMANCLTQTKLKDRTVIISGLGGVGKTEIVREYVTNTKIFKYVIVIDASSSKTAEKSFKDFAADVLKRPAAKTKATITSVYQYFARKTDGETLFIFEDAEKLQEGEETGFLEFHLTKFLGEISKIPVVLIISRHTGWTFPKRNQMYIDTWQDVEAVQYLTLRFEEQDIPVTKKVTLSMDQLGNSLHCFPLGLSIAISNILKDRENSAVNKILNYLRDKEKDHEAWRVQGMRDSASNYMLTMDTVFDSDIRNIYSNKDDGVKALHLLRLLSNHRYVNPEGNPQITCVQMDDLCARNELGTDVKKALRLLYKYSIFVRHASEDGELLSSQIHDIIQLCRGKWIGSYLHQFCNEIKKCENMV